MYVTSDEFWQSVVILSAIESDLHALWAVGVFVLFMASGLLLVALLGRR